MIEIGEGFAITADTWGYTLIFTRKAKETHLSSAKGLDPDRLVTESVGHYGSLCGALEGFLEIAVRKKVAENEWMTVRSLADYIESLCENLDGILHLPANIERLTAPRD